MPVGILVVDDDDSLRTAVTVILRGRGYLADAAAGAREALALLEKKQYDVVLVDLRMEGMSGLEAVPRIKAIAPRAVLIIMTAYGTIRTAVEAVRAGAFDYITKPFEMDELLLVIEQGLRMRDLAEENAHLRGRMLGKSPFPGIIGTSPAMQRVYEMINKVAPYDVTVLIAGESGTGKELVAQAIHDNSARRDRPLVKLNCAAVPDTLLESELFGHEKGAFTGAQFQKPGKFEAADTGTIFLDEVGDMSPSMQAKLLRVLQEKEFERVGGRETIRVDVRILAATNRDLAQAVANGSFREDLYYRLNIVTIVLPPLRERAEDIPLLVQHFVHMFNAAFHKDFEGPSPEAMDLLMRYHWPGNVRELKNVIEQAVLLGTGSRITPEHLPAVVREHAERKNASIRCVERDHIRRVLESCGWNQRKAAEILGIHRNTLRRKLEEFSIAPPAGTS